jgi:hypothetical protein|tara:strand:+ start:341 stop:541 length:201 start_codon:yes stop_codon:yes gene_type:complete
MIITGQLLNELETIFSLDRVMHSNNWDETNRIMGQVDVVNWIKDKQEELNKEAITGGDSKISIKHE